MSEELFRKEVLDARRNGWLGEVSVAQPMRVWLLTWMAAAVALSVVLFLALATYTRRSTVTGQLIPSTGMVAVLSPATGVVSQMRALEGEETHPDQRLAIVTVPRATIAGGRAADAIAAKFQNRREGLRTALDAQMAVQDIQLDGLQKQLAQARSEHRQLQLEIATRMEQIRIAKETLDRLKQLEDQRYVSILQIKQQESAWLDHTANVQAMQRQATSLQRSIVQLEQSVRALPGDRKKIESGFEVDLATLEQEEVENEARGALVVTAPVAGVIANQLVKLGQSVDAGQPMLNILPEGGVLEADLLVPSRAIGFIAVGDTVQLRYQAFPYQKFGHQVGQVKLIGRSALNGSDLGSLIGAARTNEPFYRVTVSLKSQEVFAYGHKESLKPGMLLEADILGENRSLIEWVFEPLYALKGKLLKERS